VSLSSKKSHHRIDRSRLRLGYRVGLLSLTGSGPAPTCCDKRLRPCCSSHTRARQHLGSNRYWLCKRALAEPRVVSQSPSECAGYVYGNGLPPASGRNHGPAPSLPHARWLSHHVTLLRCGTVLPG